MKRLKFHRAIVAIAMMLIGWLPSLAHDFEVDGIFYDKLNSSEVAVAYKGDYTYSYSNEYAGDVVIPLSVEYNGITYSVTSIGNDAFYDCSSLTNIEIPSSVTSIGESAFMKCPRLTSIEIPNSVTSIGNGAFYYTSLTSVIWNSVRCSDFSSSSRHFENCPNITSFTFGDEVEHIPAYLCYNLSKLRSIQIPNSVTSIGEYAFCGCSSLPSIQIPNSVTSIGNRAFYYCSSLTSVEIGNSVTSIGNYAFSECPRLTSIEIPNSVTSIGDNAFSDCSSLASIEIGNSVTSIGDNAFSDCSSLTSIQIPNSVTSIGESAFRGCESLTSVEIGNSVTSIGSSAFYWCSSLTSVEIGNNVTSIGEGAFYLCSSLASIEIPNSVTSIGGGAFYWCSSLTSVEIGNNVTSIGGGAFGNCTGLTSIEIPNSVTSIGSSAFSSCSSLTSVEIGNNVTSIGNSAFFGCSSLASIEIPNSVTSIGNSAFEGCSSLASIEIGNSVTSIGNYAFSECSSLTSIQIPNSVTSIGNYAFYHCSSLTSIQIPNSVTSIGEKAFYDCYGLTKITCLATNPPAIVSTTFSNYSIELYVPKGCISAYQSANYWKNFNIKEIVTLSTSIALNQTTATLKATETITLIATVLPENATDKSVKWSSSDETVAVVDENGAVTAIAVGEAIITVITVDGSNLSASCKVTIAPTLATSITLDKTEYEIVEKSDFQLVATVLPELATDKGVVWSSSDKWVASVDENGLVTAYSVGEAIITATTTDGSNLSASCNITVVPTLATSITLDKTEYEIVEKSDFQLVATVLPELATDKGVAWSSSDKWVASVDENGLVTAYSVGEAIITATTTDGSNLSASCKVTVLPTLAESITLNKTEISLEATETATLIATVLPEATFNKGVEWSSTDETVAVVDENGVVTAIAVGEAVITATTVDGSNKSATCKVTVVPTLAVSIELDQTEASVEEKSDLQLTATILPEHATNKEVAWSSSDKWVASVDNTGLVTMYSAGEVVITATTTDGTNLSATCRINVYSGIDGVEGDDLIVATIGDNIVVKNAQLGSVVNVYASNGALVASEVATEGDVIIEAPAKGVYVVKVGKQTVKVII